MTVNALRKSSSEEETITLAKSLIKAWKKLLDTGDKKKVEVESSSAREERSKAEQRDKERSSSKGSFTGDEVRSRCRDLLLAAIRGEELPEGVTGARCEELATNLEESIFNQFKQTNPKYKNQVRSRVFNLKDKKNSGLREGLLMGSITAQRLAVMTSGEMASDEVKQQREAFIKEGINDSALAIAEGTKSGLIKCGGCGKSNTTYHQAQTRLGAMPLINIPCLQVGG
jgi:transcription elongation factor S-II